MTVPRRAGPLTILLCLAPLVAAVAQSAPDEAALMALGRSATAWMYDGVTDSLQAHMTPEVWERIGGADGINRQRDQILMQAGGEVEVVEEKMTRRQGKAQYWREAKFDLFTNESIVLRFVFDDDGRIIGAGISPKSMAPAPDA